MEIMEHIMNNRTDMNHNQYEQTDDDDGQNDMR